MRNNLLHGVIIIIIKEELGDKHTLHEFLVRSLQHFACEANISIVPLTNKKTKAERGQAICPNSR